MPYPTNEGVRVRPFMFLTRNDSAVGRTAGCHAGRSEYLYSLEIFVGAIVDNYVDDAGEVTVWIRRSGRRH